jgi:hypothetical protein
MNQVLELVLEASRQLYNPFIIMAFNNELNPFSRTQRNSPKCWETEILNAK